MKQSPDVYRRIAGLVLRLWLGALWLSAGLPKIFGAQSDAWVGSEAGKAVTGFLKGAIAKSQFDAVKNPNPEVSAWFASFLADVALPNAATFSYMVAFGEVLVGLALVLGIFTRFSASMGLLMNLSYLLAGTSSTNPLMLMASLTIILVGGKAVSWIGLDTLVRPWLARLLPAPARRLLLPAS